MSLHCQGEDHVVGGAQGEGLEEFENLAEYQPSKPLSVQDLPDKLTCEEKIIILTSSLSLLMMDIDLVTVVTLTLILQALDVSQVVICIFVVKYMYNFNSNSKLPPGVANFSQHFKLFDPKSLILLNVAELGHSVV